MTHVQPAWYQEAVFYEIFIRSFYDANNDGWGDLAGITAKLDYLQWLGVDCLWLLPFFDSPQRDGGYDVADFYKIHPKYGTLDDLKTLLAEAHARGIRVLGDLVLNHTSDQHPWFQEARQPGSAKRDWYVWSDTPNKYKEARVIFTDYEDSNWQWDDTAQAYYWHRFFRFQPDLNYDNPEVQEAILQMVRYWLDFGLDGFRVDALRFLFEREGTNCESLPETHAFLKRLRQEASRTKPDAVLLAETRETPENLLPYFGDSNECHMGFHFPMVSEIFNALRTGKAAKMHSLLAATPALPEGCQWGIFLRDHDDMYLRSLGDQERTEFLDFYAHDPRARIKLGLRSRLAPLLGYSPARIKTAYSLLLTLPGTPVLYYGDDIGMADDLALNDRDTVRTPMPWTAEAPLAGFSQADPHLLPLPMVTDGPAGWQQVNVAAARQQADSTLNWLQQAIALRRQNSCLQSGAHSVVTLKNAHVMAYLRHNAHQRVLILLNLTAAAQEVQLPADLQAAKATDLWQHRTLELQNTPLTLAGYEYRWLLLS